MSGFKGEYLSLKRTHVVIIAVIVIILIITSFLLVELQSFSNPPEPFYVGVTYGGQSVEDAKLLIDKVKNYTNLFVLQSSVLQFQPEKINEICEYAVSSGMYFIVSFSYASTTRDALVSWVETYAEQWGEHVLGVYFDDEPCGKMLDNTLVFRDYPPYSTVTKNADGKIACQTSDYTVTYYPDGHIFTVAEFNTDDETLENGTLLIHYYPNGTISGHINPNTGGDTVMFDDKKTLGYPVDSYGNLTDSNPFSDANKTASVFVNNYMQALQFSNKSVTAFTADYVLYWFDYLAGYDVVLAELGWNNTVAQEIGLVRGAANLQNKSWGTIITWTYTQAPYLASGEEIYQQMCASYECGAEYVVVFNYAPDMETPYGTLQDEHFDALERFWNDVVQSPNSKHGSVTVDAVLVLPENYGWGMRTPQDKIWGLWGPDEKSQQIWNLSRTLLDQYGTRLDIVYDDPNFPVAGKYSNVYYWNQTVN